MSEQPDTPDAWIDINGTRYRVCQVWVIPTGAEFLTLDDDDTPIFWAGDHLEHGTPLH